MADKKLMIDTRILIDYFRKTEKAKSKLVAHFLEYDQIFISTITEFEIYNGAQKIHQNFWEGMLSRFTVLDFDRPSARQAAEIVLHLKIKRKSIDKPELFIAATAVSNGLILDTLNVKHFANIESLKLLSKTKSSV